MHSHHSHSGDYVAHASDTLEAVVQRACDLGFAQYCLTEHMPRLEDRFLYPEEIERGYRCLDLTDNFNRFLAHAQTLQRRYNAAGGTKLLVGFEVEGLNAAHIEYTKQLLAQPGINMTVGSVHFVNEIPIDFSAELWLEAMLRAPGGTARALYAQYFELQHQVIAQLHPTVIGHFDLIRLFAPADAIDPSSGKRLAEVDLATDWPDVWALVVRNIESAALYGALFELNSAAFRKGWLSPYPHRDVCDAIKQYGGARFCLSDDAHSVSQVGLNYHKVWDFVQDLGLEYIYNLDIDGAKTTVARQRVQHLLESAFWDQYKRKRR